MRNINDKIRAVSLLLAITALAIILSSCAKDTATDPNGFGFTTGIITFTAFADSASTDLDIFYIDTEDFSPEVYNISNSIANDHYPVWLHDRSAVAYISSSNLQSSIYQVNPLTLEQNLLLASTELIRQISTSPTEPRLAYLHTITGQSELALNLLNLETLDTLALNSIPQNNNPLMAWSADGVKLAVGAGIVQVYEAATGRFLYPVNTAADYLAWDLGAERLYVVRSGDLFLVDTLSNISILTGFGLRNPVISPNRKYMAAVSQSRGNEVVVIDLAFTSVEGVKQITLPAVEFNDFRLISWSPNSREIVFIDLDDNRWNLFKASEDYGYSPSRVTDDYTLKKSVNW